MSLSDSVVDSNQVLEVRIGGFDVQSKVIVAGGDLLRPCSETIDIVGNSLVLRSKNKFGKTATVTRHWSHRLDEDMK